MSSYEIKKYIIDNKIDREVAKIRYKQWILSNCNGIDIDIMYKELIKYIDKIGYDIFHVAEKLNNNLSHKKRRIFKYIFAMVNTSHCFFLSINFNDITLNKTTYDIRRRYIREFLKDNSDYYIANIDFGEKNGREHYHAVIMCDHIDREKWSKYGFCHYKHVRNNYKSIEALSYYVNKMTNHALKKSTGRSFPIIYSRQLKILLYNK